MNLGIRCAGSSATAVRKETLEQGRASRLLNSAKNLRPVVACRLLKYARAMIDTAALGVIGAKIHTPYACQRYCRRAHRARLKSHMEIRVHEPLLTKPPRRRLKHEQFRVCGRIVLDFNPIVGTRQNLARTPVDQDRANGHFTHIRGSARLVQSHIHGRKVGRGHGRRVPVTLGPVKHGTSWLLS
jgi:hypothetical protein